MDPKTTFWIVEATTNQTYSFHRTKYDWIEEFPTREEAEMALETRFTPTHAQRKRDEILASLEDDQYDEYTANPRSSTNERPVGEIIVEYDVIATPEDRAWDNAFAAQNFHHHWKEPD